jgi:nucleoside phosphorylase
MLERYPRRKTILKASIGPETYFLGKFGAFRTAVTRCGMGGEGERGSRLATPDAINAWHPKAIIMPGIAFGHNPKKQKMADVLVASKIIPYEHQRLGQERIFRAAIPPSSATLQNRFENALGWRFERPDGRFSTLHIGSILSGGKLVDNLEFKNDLFKSFPEAIGGEMEGAGLAEAAGRNRVPWILVKAICDWGTGKSNAHQHLAAAASLSLVHHVLSQRNSLNGL